MKQVVAIIHNVRSIHNVASIFRTADGAGIIKLYLVGITPTPHDQFGRIAKPFHKVALGAEESVPWEQVTTVKRAITKLKKDGYYIVAVEQAENAIALGSKAFKKIKKEAKNIALVMGEEVDGIAPNILKACDAIVEIPMHGKKESLNVSVAFGIAAYALVR